jgi:transcriptional regulator with XRE-family HTH domain
MKKIIAPRFFDRVGKKIIEWLKENARQNRKPYNQKQLALLLKITPSQLSRYINGINEMPASVVSILIDHLGFSSNCFTDYYAEKQNGIIPEYLTKEDLYKLIFQQQLLIKEWKDFGLWHSDRARRLLDDNRDLIASTKKILDENEKLRNELKNATRNV